MDFAEQFKAVQAYNREFKKMELAKRALRVQINNKIQPAALRPDLLVAPRMRGGDSGLPVPNALELYYPSGGNMRF